MINGVFVSLLQIDAHEGSVNDLSFSYPNSQLCMVTCGDDMLIKVTEKCLVHNRFYFYAAII